MDAVPQCRECRGVPRRCPPHTAGTGYNANAPRTGEGIPVDQQYYRSSLSTGAPLPLTPLIDTVFLIVVFFMVNATFAVHSTIPVQLPRAAADEAAGTAALAITVDAAGQIYVERDGAAAAVTLDGLRAAVGSLQAAGAVSRVVLHGDTGARYGRLVAVMDVLRGAGVTDLNLVTARLPTAP